MTLEEQEKNLKQKLKTLRSRIQREREHEVYLTVTGFLGTDDISKIKESLSRIKNNNNQQIIQKKNNPKVVIEDDDFNF